MSAVREVIEELENSLQSSSSEHRLQMLRSVTALYLQGAASHTEESIELFDQALNLLIDYMDTQALARLSSQLAPIAAAPLRVVQRLARHDAIEVAEPLLRESKRLRTADLIELANTKSQAHLIAMGTRSELSETVTDAMVARGNAEVALTIAANPGARFSERGFSKLVHRAEVETGLAEIIAVRAEMSAHRFRELVSRATDAVRQRLMSLSDPRLHASIKRVVSQIAREVERAALGAQRDYSAAQTLVNSLRGDNDLLRVKLLEYVNKAHLEETVVCLALLGELSVGAVDAIIMKRDDGGILLLCKGLGLLWPTVHAILSLSTAAGGARVADDSFARFERLSISSAERVLRFWRVRARAVASNIA
jgi:uncharacterized protein (DUF2336 family)